MGGFSTSNGQSGSNGGGSNGGGNSGANITGGGNVKAPSGQDLQNQVGGLFNLGNVTEGFQNFMSPITDTVRGIQDDGNKFLTSMFETNSGKNLFDKVQSNIFGIKEEEIAPDQGQVAAEIINQQVADRTPDPVVEPTPEPVVEPVVEDNGWGDVKTDNDAINWALKKGDISQEDANWLRRWSAESVRGGRKKNVWATGGGGAQNWDAAHSGLNSGNRAIAERFKNSIKGNWGDPRNIHAIEQGADFDGDGDVTNAEWKKHMEGSQTEAPQKGKAKKRKGMTAEEMRLAREAALARFTKVSL